MRKWWLLIAAALILAFPMAAIAQQPTTGTLQGVVSDRDGAALPGARVIINGPLGETAVQTDENGNFEMRFLPAGTYSVKVQMDNFSGVRYEAVEVNAGQRTKLPITLLPGQVEQVTVSGTPLVDPKQLEISTTFKTGDAAGSLTVGRNFTDAVAFATGVVSGLGTGQGNYSVGGASGLENSYIIDGVNITDSGYGGVGTYSIVFGSLGSGITTDFLEEVQVKTAGFEAEYGQALGGIISGVVKSGTDDLAGSVRLFVSPDSAEANGKDVSLPTGAINTHDRGETDIGISAGGPIAADRAFWFAAFNPVSDTRTRYIEPITNPIFSIDPLATSTYPDPNLFPGAFSSREVKRDRNNYAAKFNFLATPNHRIELTVFGDPSDGDGRSGIATGTFVMEGDSDGDGTLDPAASKTAAGFAQNGVRSTIDYGADQQTLKYNGLFGGEWFLEGQVSHRDNEFSEVSTVNDYRYRDRRAYFEWFLPQLFGLGQSISQVGQPLAGGAGFVGPTMDETWDYALKVTKNFGDHELKFGGEFFDLEYTQIARYSGPQFTLPFPADFDNDGTIDGSIPITTNSGALVDVRGGIPTCTACLWSTGDPYYRVIRARFGQEPGPVTGDESAIFVQDTWTVNDNWVIKLGARTTTQELTGSSGFMLPLTRESGTDYSSAVQTFSPNSYKFDTEISPRIGFSYDPSGAGKSKFYLHYARYFGRVPADLAVRQFSNEVGTSRFEFTDPALTNWRGTSISLQGLGQGTVASGTKLPYEDEVVLGWQQLITPTLSFEVRGIYRDQGRVLEDVQFASVEAIQNYYYGGYSYDSDSDGTVDTTVSLPFPSYGSAGFGNYVLANPGNNTAGANFGSPQREYKALEVEFIKRLSDNWRMIANYRYSRLRGNYEGLFRNDNGQSDPNITSLYDFPDSGIMRGQFAAGPLNTDRPHVMHVLGTYQFDNGFEVGGGFNWQSGVPRTALLAHPIYINSGEIPGQDPQYLIPDGDPDADGTIDWVLQAGNGSFLGDYTDAPRGSLGRTPDTATIDLHLGYTAKIRDSKLKVVLDVFNLFNNQEVALLDDLVEFSANTPSATFNKILAYELPRAVRASVIWDW